MKNLTNDQREQILGWVEMALGIGAVVLILPKLISIFTSLTTLMSPIGLAIAAIGLALSMLSEGDVAAIWETIKGAVKSMWETCQPIFEGIKQGFLWIIDGITSLLEMAEGPLGTIKEIFKEVFTFIGGLIGKFIDSIGWVIKKLMQLITIVATVVKAIATLDFSDLGSRIEANLNELDTKLDAKSKARVEASEAAKAQKATNKASGKQKEQFQSMAQISSPKVMSGLDAYRAVQTAAQGKIDKQLLIQQEMLQNQKQDRKIFEKIAENTSKPIGEQ